MSSLRLHIAPVDWDAPDAVRLRGMQQAELDGRYGSDSEPGVKPSAADVAVFVLARADSGAAVGCGGLRHLGGDAAEIKRMFVVPERRGQGIARRILVVLEAAALASGWPVLRLETGPLQPEAIGLYQGAGYQPIATFGAYVGDPLSRCFEKRLVG